MTATKSSKLESVIKPLLEKHFPQLRVVELGSSYLAGIIGPWSLFFILDGYEVTSSRGKRGLSVRLVEGTDFEERTDNVKLCGKFGWPECTKEVEDYLERVKLYLKAQVEEVQRICGC